MTCTTCVEVGRRGYCAPLRCYCGHETCHGFSSYVKPATPNISTPKQSSSGVASLKDAWSNREDVSWIDKL